MSTHSLCSMCWFVLDHPVFVQHSIIRWTHADCCSEITWLFICTYHADRYSLNQIICNCACEISLQQPNCPLPNRSLKILLAKVLPIYRPNSELRRACCNCFNMAFFNDYNPQYSYHRYPKQSYLLFLDECTKKILGNFFARRW